MTSADRGTRNPSSTSRFSYLLAGEHGYRDVTGERWRLSRWLAYWLWRVT